MEEFEYITVENVLKEAGFWQESRGEPATGAVDGANRVFFTSYKPIYNSENTVALVNDVDVGIESVDPEKGQVTLINAPAANDRVTITYRYSSIDLDFVNMVIDDAQAWINSQASGYDSCYPYSEGKVPQLVMLATRIYAAGLLLTRDYGYNTDTELTSKDGYRKIKLAEDTIAKYIANGGCNGGSDDDDIDSNGGIGSINASSRGDFFGSGPERRCMPCSDICFDRNIF